MTLNERLAELLSLAKAAPRGPVFTRETERWVALMDLDRATDPDTLEALVDVALASQTFINGWLDATPAAMQARFDNLACTLAQLEAVMSR